MAIERMEAEIVVGVDQKSLKQSEAEIARLKSPEAIKMAVDLGALRRQLALVNGSIKQAQAAGDLTAEIKFRGDAEIIKKQITGANRELTNFVRTGDQNVSVLGKLFEKLGFDIRSGTGKALVDVTENMSSFVSKGLLLAGGAAIGAGFVALGSAALNLGDKLEQAQISFETMLGSADKAKKLLGDLSQFAAKTPFEIAGIRESAKQLLAYGIASQDIVGTLKILGDVSAGVGKPLGQIALVYGQVRTAGKLYTQDLNQFTQAGIPIIAQLAKQFNVTEGAVRDLTEKGKIGFGDIQKAFIAMTSEGGLFFNLMEKQSQSLTGRISNLKDQFSLMVEKLGTALVPAAKAVVSALSDILTFFNSAAGKAVLLGVAATALGSALAFLTPVVLGLGASFLTAAAGATTLAGIMALLGGPITLIGVALGVVAGASYYAYESFNGLTGATGDLQKKLNDLKEAQDENEKAFKDGTISSKEYEKATKDNAAAQDSLKRAIDEVKNGSVSYETVKNRINALKKIADTEGYNAETLAINTQINALRELLRVKSVAAKTALQSFQNAKGKEPLLTQQGSTLLNRPDPAAEAETAKAFAEYQKANEEAIKAEKEVKNLEDALKKVQDNRAKSSLGLGGGGAPSGGGSGKKKSAEELANEERKKQEARLKVQAEADIKEVNESRLSEKRKAEVILAIKDKLEKDIKAVQGKSIENEFDAAKNKLDIIKETEKKRKEIQKDALDYTKKLLKDELDANKDALDKTKARIKELEDVMKDFQENGKKMSELTTDTTQKVADRYKEIKDQIDSINESQSEATDAVKEYARIYGDKIFDKSLDNQSFNGTDVKDIRDYVKEQKKLADLEKELALAKSNTNEEALKNTTLNDTEKILADAAKKKQELLDEKQAIQDKLGLRQTQVEDELRIEKKRKDDLTIVIEEYQKSVDSIEKRLTATVEEQTKARNALYAQEEERLRKLIALRTEAGLSVGAVPVSNNTTTNNNNPTVIVNATVSNNVDVNTLGKGLADQITLANKGIKK